MMKIRTAILGYGRSGSTLHAGPIEKNPDFELAAACDIDPARRDEAARRFGCPVYEDYREMLRRERLDLVCVVTRNDQHADMTVDCLRAGVNVLVTKPWAADAAQARRMMRAAAESGRILLPWLPARWGSDLRRLRECVKEGRIGDLFLIRRTVASFGTRCDWQTERRFAGGYLLNWGPHIVDPPCLLAGGRVRSVYGRLRQTINPGDVEDLFLALITMDNGILLQVEYTISPAPLPSWVVQGTRGTILVSGRALTFLENTPCRPADPTQFATLNPADTRRTEETVGPHLYGDEHEIYGDVAAALRGERSFPVTPDDAWELTRTLDAIRCSQEEDRMINLQQENRA